MSDVRAVAAEFIAVFSGYGTHGGGAPVVRPLTCLDDSQ
jgi:hypothetical protein